MKPVKTKTGVNSSRRRALRQMSAGCGAMATTPMVAQMLSLAATRSALAATPQSDFKALVVLFLFGGNDGHNMLVPMDPSEYADYQSIRTNMSLPQTDLLATTIGSSSGRPFAFHPSMPFCTDMYRAGELNVVANVGTLVEPTTMQQYQNRSTQRPAGLFSHSDQQRSWQTATPQSRVGLTGWAGRTADMLSDTVNSNPSLSINYSIDGENLMLTGDTVTPYVLDRSRGAHVLEGYGGSRPLDRILTRAHDSLTGATYSNLLQASLAQTKFHAVDGALEYNQRTADVQLNTVFPTHSLGREFERVAKTIAVQEALGQTRQLFFIGDGGWDNHSNLLSAQERNLREVDEALKAFRDAIVELGAQGKVTCAMASDFARTLTSNGRGSDHAWGSNMLVLGPGSVNGGDIFGEYPVSLDTGGPLYIGRGRLLPTVSTDEYYGELASWLGVSGTSTEMEQILPNVRNFWDGTGRPLGFMS